jgi:hypothetical protein
MAQLLNSTESARRRRRSATESLSLRVVSAFALMVTVSILSIVVDTINPIMEDHKEKLCLKRVCGSLHMCSTR